MLILLVLALVFALIAAFRVPEPTWVSYFPLAFAFFVLAHLIGSPLLHL